MTAPTLCGAVLVGGESRRFGRDKAQAEVAGVPLALRAFRAVSALTPYVHLVGRASPAPLALPHLADARPGQGPLAGVEAALARAAEVGARGVVVLACDLPLVDPPVLTALVRGWAAATDPERSVALPDDPVQPLAAVWGVGLLPRVRDALDRGRRRVVDLVEETETVRLSADLLGARVGLDGATLLSNVNRPDHLAGLRVAVLPPVLTVVGWKDSGKTSAAVSVLQALHDRGVAAAAAKHGHGFRLDHPGTDSWRLRHETRAPAVLLAGPEGEIVQRVARSGDPPGGTEAPLAELIRRYMADAPLVVAEGWKAEGWLTVEVQGEKQGEPIVPATGAEAGRALARIRGVGSDVPRVDGPRGPGGGPVRGGAPGEALADALLDRVAGLL